jgi:hypothetical protein
MPGRAPRKRRDVKVIETFTAAPTSEPISLDKYPKGYLAILDREIIDHDLDFAKLDARMKCRGIEEEVVYTGVPQWPVRRRRR